MNKLNLLLVACTLILLTTSPSYSFDLQSAAFSLNTDSKDISTSVEYKKISELLDNVENSWNNHDINKLNNYYSDDFINGDGLDFESITDLTKDLWGAYPDIMSKSQDRVIRIFGEYATIESTDLYEGISSKVREEVGTKGSLKAVSMGQLFLKKFGPKWKITSDKTLFEKVSIGYGEGIGLIDQDKIRLNAPEQVPGGKQYTTRLDFDLPKDIKPVAAISKEVLIFPQVTTDDKFRLTNELKLEKWITANNVGKNELITATVGLTGEALKPQLIGLVFLTKRVNVIPVSDEDGELSIIKTPAKSALNKSVELLDTFKDGKSKKKDKKSNDDKEKDPNTEF
jgi:hypothetical protein